MCSWRTALLPASKSRTAAPAKPIRWRARYVVVGADALRTPQLLWASGIRPDALGRYLNDQAQVVFASRLRDVTAPQGRAAAQTARSVSRAELPGFPTRTRRPSTARSCSWMRRRFRLADDDPVVPGSIVGLGLFCAKDLQREDRVAFDDGVRDSYGMPAMTHPLPPHARGITRCWTAPRQEIVRLGKAVGEPLDERPFVMPLGASLHYQGTTTDGRKATTAQSVCSPDSEVWQVPGLFVAGNGVIPTATACNPDADGRRARSARGPQNSQRTRPAASTYV